MLVSAVLPPVLMAIIRYLSGGGHDGAWPSRRERERRGHDGAWPYRACGGGAATTERGPPGGEAATTGDGHDGAWPYQARGRPGARGRATMVP